MQAARSGSSVESAASTSDRWSHITVSPSMCVLTEEHDRCQSSNDDSVGGLDGAILQAAIPEQRQRWSCTADPPRGNTFE